ncbi:hypothetical protein MHPYR_780004 [uncultured Mycobacterium sp.]|uniref:Uncharacterized protein n=1 Tax=uncultured Mycobacterium sp. TaxID=171292 RepID=A0A1Y5PT84_9MYCO|nr:hypothetical protein MHPYR_780004 [uncultured Mycobacterium sp.]
MRHPAEVDPAHRLEPRGLVHRHGAVSGVGDIDPAAGGVDHMRGSWSSGGGSFHGVGRCVDRHHQVVAAADRVHRRTVATHLDVVRFFQAAHSRGHRVGGGIEHCEAVPALIGHPHRPGGGRFWRHSRRRCLWSGDVVFARAGRQRRGNHHNCGNGNSSGSHRRVLSPVPQRAVPSGSSRHALHRRDDFRMPLRRGTIIDHARAIAPAARFLERIFTEPSSIQRHPCALLELARGGRPRFAARLCYGLLVRRWCRTSRMRSSPQCGFIFEERSGRR